MCLVFLSALSETIFPLKVTAYESDDDLVEGSFSTVTTESIGAVVPSL